MEKRKIFEAIDLEIRRAKKKHPNWPIHVAAQAGIVCEEAGELMRAALNWKYERWPAKEGEQLQRENIRMEAIHVAASAIRFLENLDEQL